jgi:hypothetical protein
MDTNPRAGPHQIDHRTAATIYRRCSCGGIDALARCQWIYPNRDQCKSGAAPGVTTCGWHNEVLRPLPDAQVFGPKTRNEHRRQVVPLTA